ncbi:MAG TPA: ribosome-associated translation inhibitor RaiA [Candidatus Paceibacterota bacterium]|nr:ribosome-associated translation inhibitor RaiA [Candidatus Paceibacterota bacterium]
MLKQHLKATNIELTDAISDYVEKKIGVLEKIIAPQLESLAEVEVGKTTNHHNKGDVFRAEVNLTMGDKQLRAVAVENDLYKAIDKVKDGIVREVKNAKGRRENLIKRGHRKLKGMMRGLWGGEE